VRCDYNENGGCAIDEGYTGGHYSLFPIFLSSPTMLVVYPVIAQCHASAGWVYFVKLLSSPTKYLPVIAHFYSGNGCHDNGVSGSVHWNKHLTEKDSVLQGEILAKVSDAVISAYAHKDWYKKLMDVLEKPENQHLKKHLIPGTPCTSIWWNTDHRPFNKHHDWTH